MNRAFNNSSTKRNGFTMVELMLSMGFVSVLLVVILMTVMQITSIYNKGISMREVNQVGRAISEDLQRSISSSSPFKVATGPDSRYIAQNGGGRLCTGQYSYLWNYGNATNPPNKFSNGELLRMVKIADASTEYCTSPGRAIPAAQKAQTVDLLKSGDRDLAIHDFAISLNEASANDTATQQALYSVQFVIGTKDKALLTPNNSSCKPPATSQGGQDYCAVNKFELIARAGNEAPLKE